MLIVMTDKKPKAEKLEKPVKKNNLIKYSFPTLNVVIEAESYEQALDILNKK